MLTKLIFSIIVLVMLPTIVIVLSADTTMLGINQQVEAAIAIKEKGVKIDSSESPIEIIKTGEQFAYDVKLNTKA